LKLPHTISAHQTHIYNIYAHMHVYTRICMYTYLCMYICVIIRNVYIQAVSESTCMMGWLRLVGFLKLYVSLAKEPYQRDNILQRRPMILRSLILVATTSTHQPIFIIYIYIYTCTHVLVCMRWPR